MADISAALAPPARPTLTNYIVVYAVLIGSVGLVVALTRQPADTATPQALVRPMFALMGLTACVWIAMAVVRNLMVSLGKASMRYYHRYAEEAPPEWIERPGRTFNNLMQVPPMFYAVCLIAMTLDQVDGVQVQLAWLFVALRVVHALIMLLWNYVPYRFAAYNSANIALAALAFQVARRCW